MAKKRRLAADDDVGEVIDRISQSEKTHGKSSIIDSANALPLSTLESLHMSRATSSPSQISSGIIVEHTVSIETAESMSPVDFQTCYELIKATSSEAYKKSSVGWSPIKKKKEMKLPDLRYLLVKRKRSSVVGAFLSFMFTIEDNHEVAYCYEIHVADQLRGHGVGKHLMGVMEDIGRSVGVEKAMLTVFLKNEAGMRFYERLGYAEDDFSPPAKRLRNGLVKKPNYVILSKALQ
ncbi:MAG: hypothetical protein M1835_003239 [Candelina submexicana]|nr:MAG: hypothetical protein M1835_003239 [Candelina submexicana]